jgi:hypothetical protein
VFRPALIAAALVLALLAAHARAEGAPAPRAAAPAPDEIPAELRDTLPGGSRVGAAPELPSGRIDVLPQPTQVRIHVRRRAPARKD